MGSQPTDAQNFVTRFLINPDNSISPPNGGLCYYNYVFRIFNQKASWYPVAGNAYLHTGGVLNRRLGGGTHFWVVRYAVSYLELLLAFSLWLGEWDHFTRRTGDISKDIKHVWLLFCTYYIAWIFQWILGDEGRGEWWLHQVHRADQHRVWTPQCAASWMLLLYARDSSRWLLTPGPQFLSGGGGGGGGGGCGVGGFFVFFFFFFVFFFFFFCFFCLFFFFFCFTWHQLTHF